MPLPTLPTTKEIRDRIVADIELKINQATPLFFKSFTRVIAAALALVFTILYKYGQWAYKQIFTVTQGEESLELKGSQYDVLRKPATASVISATATGDDLTVIPAGQTFRGSVNGLVYSVNTAVGIITSSIEVELTCLTAGANGNLLTGDTLTILQPIPGLDNLITVIDVVTEGEDEESIGEYRARISSREKRQPQGGALVDFIAWAKEVPGVTRAFCFGKREVPAITAGRVEVYPLSDDDPVSRIPSPAKLAEVLAYIDDPTRAPTQCVGIDVLAVTEREFTVDISALVPDSAALKADVEDNISDFLLTRAPQQFLDQIGVVNVVSRSYIESICILSGCTSVTLELFIDGVGPAVESYTLLHGEVCKLDTVIFP